MRVLKAFASFLTIVLSVVILAFAIGTAVLSFDGEAFLARIESAMHEPEECDMQFETNVGGKINYESGIYQNGEEINLLATPKPGYVFVGWYGPDETLISTENKISFTAHHNLKLHAVFAPVSNSGNEGGSAGGNEGGSAGGNEGGSTGGNEGGTTTQPPAGGSTVEHANAESFRNVYQHYNQANANMTQTMFENSLDNLFEVKEVISAVIDSYTDNLFAQLEDMKAKEDEQGTQESLFMDTEPAAFNAMYTHVNGILQDGANYQPKEEEIVDMIDCISRSETCVATMGNVVEAVKENTALADSFQSMPEEVKTVVTETLTTYKQEAEEGSNNSVVCQQLADLLGIDLSKIDAPSLPDLGGDTMLPDLGDSDLIFPEYRP